jgi:hypothetical protein
VGKPSTVGRRAGAGLLATLGLAALSLGAVPLGPMDRAALAPAAAASDLNGWKVSWGAGFSQAPSGCAAVFSALGPRAWWDPAVVGRSAGSLVLHVRPPTQQRPSSFGALACVSQARTYGRYAITLRSQTLPADVLPFLVLYPVSPAIRSDASPLRLDPPSGVVPPTTILALPRSGKAQTFVVEWTPTALKLIAGGRTRVFASPTGRRFPVFAAAPAGLTQQGAGSTGVTGSGAVIVDTVQTWDYSPSTVAPPPPPPRTTRPRVTPPRITSPPPATTRPPTAPTLTAPPSTAGTPTTTAPTATGTGTGGGGAIGTPTATAAGPTAVDADRIGSGTRAALVIGLLIAAAIGVVAGRRLVLARSARSGRDGG